MTLDLTGVIPPLATPRGADGELDRESLARLCRWLLDGGVTGLFVGGSTGETALLDSATQLAALDVAVAEARGRVPVLYGAVDTGTRRVLERALPAAEHGAAAVVATAPFYVVPHARETMQHFDVLAARLPVPVVAYDIPSATHSPIGPRTAIALARAGSVVALKDSTGDLAGMREIVAATADLPFGVLSGSETLADVALLTGAIGLVPGLGNIDPGGYVRLYRAVRAGDLAAATAEQRRLSELFRIIEVADRSRIGFTAGALGAFKVALTRLGILARPDTWEPLAALSDEEAETIAALLRAAGLHPTPLRSG